jgi:hypothetical protein
MAKKDFRKLSNQFEQDGDDELTRQQDAQLQSSLEALEARERERVLNKARQLGLVVNEGNGGQIQVTSGGLQLFGCRASSAGLEVPDDFTIEQFEQVGNLLFQLEDGIQLYIGDLLAAYERLGYGEITSIAEHYGRSPKTLSNWKYICANVTTSLRKEVLEQHPTKKPLSIGHYNVVAALSPEEQRRWLMQAAEGEWSVATLTTAIKNTPLKLKVPTWERAISGLESITARRWKKLPPSQRQHIRARLQLLLDKLDGLE